MVMSEPVPEPVYHVDASTLRAIFAAARIEERLSAGELSLYIRNETERPAPAHVHEPPGTLSHVVVYLDRAGHAHAIAHEYLRPDGSIGASGQRDPKWVRFRGAAWRLHPGA